MMARGQQGGNADVVDASRPAWQDEVKRMCTWMRLKQHYPRAKMVDFKRQLKELVRTVQEEVLRKVEERNMGQELGVDDVAQELAQACDKSMWARDAEERALKSSSCYVPPIKRFLGKKDGVKHYAYDGDVQKQLEAMWFGDLSTWRQTKAAALQWCLQSSTGHRESLAFDDNWIIEDMWDGAAFQGWLFTARERAPDALPLAFILYYDGLEVVNGLGQARLTHELGCFYWGLLNLEKESRLSHIRLHLATVCLKKSISEMGPDVVVSGTEP